MVHTGHPYQSAIHWNTGPYCQRVNRFLLTSSRMYNAPIFSVKPVVLAEPSLLLCSVCSMLENEDQILQQKALKINKIRSKQAKPPHVCGSKGVRKHINSLRNLLKIRYYLMSGTLHVNISYPTC